MEKKEKKKVYWHEQQPFFRWLEHAAHALIIPSLILLAVLLILENPLWQLVHLEAFAPFPEIADGFIIGVFVIDLIFKYMHVNNLLKWFKMYWIEIIAVFPFYLILRVWIGAQAFFLTAEELAQAQKLAHEAAILREVEVAKFVEEARLARETRLLREAGPFTRALRTGARFLRFLRVRLGLAKDGIKTVTLKKAVEKKLRHKQ